MKTITLPTNQSQTIIDTGNEIVVLNSIQDRKDKNYNQSILKKVQNDDNITINLFNNDTIEYYFLYQNQTIERNITFNLNAEGASAKLIGLFYLGDTKHQVLTDTKIKTPGVETAPKLNLTSTMIHHAPNTYGHTYVKGALSDKSKATLKGMIKIARGAHGSDDLLTERVLLLSPQARAEADPQLEIDADNVKATHAATISRINQEHLYYLQTRGLPEQKSKQFIVNGFLQEILDQFPSSLQKKTLRMVFKPSQWLTRPSAPT